MFAPHCCNMAVSNLILVNIQKCNIVTANICTCCLMEYYMLYYHHSGTFRNSAKSPGSMIGILFFLLGLSIDRAETNFSLMTPLIHWTKVSEWRQPLATLPQCKATECLRSQSVSQLCNDVIDIHCICIGPTSDITIK